jgi:hypothetical protein
LLLIQYAKDFLPGSPTVNTVRQIHFRDNPSEEFPDSALRLATPMRAGQSCHPLDDKGGGHGGHWTAESEAPVRSSAFRRVVQTGSIQVDCNPLKARLKGGTTNRTRSRPTARRSAAPVLLPRPKAFPPDFGSPFWEERVIPHKLPAAYRRPPIKSSAPRLPRRCNSPSFSGRSDRHG